MMITYQNVKAKPLGNEHSDGAVGFGGVHLDGDGDGVYLVVVGAVWEGGEFVEEIVNPADS